jgi:cytochrome c biogenesis protein CcmG/thiol:disulfide interchange protein DsbE
LPSTPSSALPEPPWRRSRWKSFLVGIGAAGVVAAVVWLAIEIRESDSGPPGRTPGQAADGAVAEVGAAAPGFELRTLDGGTIRSADLRGRPVVVNFWASWCNPCRREFPLLAQALTEHERDELAVVGVTYRDIESDSRDFVEETRASWPQGVDEDGAVAKAFGVRAIPQTFFLDADGTIAARIFGFSSKDALDEPLREILPS